MAVLKVFNPVWYGNTVRMHGGPLMDLFWFTWTRVLGEMGLYLGNSASANSHWWCITNVV